MRGPNPGRGGFGIAGCNYIEDIAVLHDVPKGRDGEAIDFRQAEMQPNLFVELKAGVEQGGPAGKVVDAPVFEEERDATAEDFSAYGCVCRGGVGRGV